MRGGVAQQEFRGGSTTAATDRRRLQLQLATAAPQDVEQPLQYCKKNAVHAGPPARLASIADHFRLGRLAAAASVLCGASASRKLICRGRSESVSAPAVRNPRTQDADIVAESGASATIALGVLNATQDICLTLGVSATLASLGPLHCETQSSCIPLKPASPSRGRRRPGGM